MEFITALITPFDSNNRIDDKALVDLCKANIEDGCDGFFVGGSVGECFLLSLEERIHLFEVVSQFKDQVDIYAHVGAIGTDHAKVMAKEALSFGIDKIGSTPPFYYGFTGMEIASYFYDLSTCVNRPVLYYDIPMATKYSLDFNNKDICELFRSGCIGSVKHTNANIENIGQMRELNESIKIYGGLESNILKLLQLNCEGFIGSTFNFMLPEFKKAVYYYYVESVLYNKKVIPNKHLDETLNLVDEVGEVVDILLKTGLQASLKYLLERKGLRVGESRTPFNELSQKDIQGLENMLKKSLFVDK